MSRGLVARRRDSRLILSFFRLNSVQGVRSYKTMAQAASQAASAAPDSTEPTAAASSSSSSITVRELFKPTTSLLPLFQAIPHTRPEGDFYLPSELKSLLTSYITTHALSHPRDQKFVQLDAVLSESLLKKGEDLEVMGKEEAGRRVKEGCVAWWSLERKGEERVVKYVFLLV